MDAAELGAAVRRTVQLTIAGRVYAGLAVAVPDAFRRTALAVGAAVLLVGGGAAVPRPPPSATALADLALAVAVSALLQDLGVSGAGGAPLRLAHLCMVLEAGQALAPLALGALAGTFLANVQFLFAQALAALLLSVCSLGAAFVCAGAACVVGAAALGRDQLLADGLISAALIVGKELLFRGLPPTLALPSLVALLSFARPLHVSLALSDPVYDFVLYQAGGALQAALASALAPATAALAGLAALCAAPTPALRAVASIAALGCLFDAAIASVSPAPDTDPLLTLLPVLVFTRVLAAYLT